MSRKKQWWGKFNQQKDIFAEEKCENLGGFW
jgi:hypothetical protein